METLRAADADRHQIAAQLKAALDEGRLSLRGSTTTGCARRTRPVRTPTSSLVADLPKPGLSAAELKARRTAELKRQARKLPMALMVLWTIWVLVATVNIVVWFLVMATAGPHDPGRYRLLAPGAALLAVTVGVQTIRHQQRTGELAVDRRRRGVRRCRRGLPACPGGGGHTVPLTLVATLRKHGSERYGPDAPIFGW